MTDITPLQFVLLVIPIAGFAFWTGWDISVRRFNARRRRERAAFLAMQEDVAALSSQLLTDDMRRGIDTGKEYAIFRVEETLDDLRKDLP